MSVSREIGARWRRLGVLQLLVVVVACAHADPTTPAPATPGASSSPSPSPTASTGTSPGPSASAATIVGTWQEVPAKRPPDRVGQGAKPGDGATSAFRFWPDGSYDAVYTVRLPVPERSETHGRYQVDGERLRLTPAGTEPTQMTYQMEWEGETLILTAPGATVGMRFERVDE